MYGYTATEALGMNISQIVPLDKKKEEMECTKQIASGRICE